MKRKKYENDDLGVSFTLPEQLTMREHLAYRSRLVDSVDVDYNTRQWLAVIPLLDDWKCEKIPDPATFDLDTLSTWKMADIILYVANTTISHMLEMEDVDPN